MQYAQYLQILHIRLLYIRVLYVRSPIKYESMFSRNCSTLATEHTLRLHYTIGMMIKPDECRETSLAVQVFTLLVLHVR